MTNTINMDALATPYNAINSVQKGIYKTNLKEARHHQVRNLQEAGSVRTADARFAGLAVPNVAGRTTAAPWSRGAVMAINACGRKKKKRCRWIQS